MLLPSALNDEGQVHAPSSSSSFNSSQVRLLVQVYFDRINTTLATLYPREPFTRWLVDVSQKATEELGVLYALLAVASTITEGPSSGQGLLWAQSADEILANLPNQDSIFASHISILLALHSFATSNEEMAWQYTEFALGTVAGLQPDSGSPYLDHRMDFQTRTPFHFVTEQLHEWKRRTFWALFFIDRLESWVLNTPPSIDIKDIFIRLPMSDSDYQAGQHSDAPFFRCGTIHPDVTSLALTDSWSLGCWLATITVIWSRTNDVARQFAFAETQRQTEECMSDQGEIQASLEQWMQTLPEHLRDTPHNLAESVQQGYYRVFVTMHTLSNLSSLTLLCSPNSARINMDPAKSCIEKLLRLSTVCDNARCCDFPPSRTREHMLSSFFLLNPAFAILHDATNSADESYERLIECALSGPKK